MNNYQRLSLEYDGIYGTIKKYTSDSIIMNYLDKLKVSIKNVDYDAIIYTLSNIDSWYDENIGDISSDEYVFNLTSHQKNRSLIKEILSKLKKEECVSAHSTSCNSLYED